MVLVVAEVVVGELTAVGRQLEQVVATAGRTEHLARVRRAVLVDQRAEQRQGLVAVVDHLDDPGLHRVVELRRGRDLPEPVAAPLRVAVRPHPVDVAVAVHERDHVRVAQQHVLQLSAEHTLRVVGRGPGVRHRRDVVVREQDHEVVLGAGAPQPPVRAVPAGAERLQLRLEPRELTPTDGAGRAAEPVGRVQRDAEYRRVRDRLERVVQGRVEVAVAEVSPP